MGCGKTRLVQGVNVELGAAEDDQLDRVQVPVLDTLQEEEKVLDQGNRLEIIEKDNESERLKFIRVERVVFVNHDEIGKVGEDYEAGVVSPGKPKEESLDFKLRKLPVPKKLPPIAHPPIPGVKALMPSSLTKFSKHKPDMDLVKLMLGNDKNKNLNDLNLDSVEAHGDDGSIQRIMQELSIDYK